ncbi:MAG: integration host factor subunit beta [Proteobacteria bacterium]|nr:integration host factor subunit beta [Pseudomonadota bacterium]
MTKSELIDKLANEIKISSREAASLINTIFDSMTEALCRDESIEIRGFGSFTVKHYDGYEGRNPKTGEMTQVKPKKLPFFKVGKELREKINTATGKN